MVREERKYVPAGFVPGLFLKHHKVEIFLLVLLVAGVLSITLLGPDKGAINEMSASLSSVIEERSQYWDEAYPYGYKIIALTGTEIVHTSFDTLPEDLEINWKDLSVSRIQTKQFGSADEKIKIGMTGIYYVPAGVSGLAITTTLTKKKGASSILTRFDDLKFVVEIIEDNGEQVFCLFGLQQG
ncbi:MAG: hypothetical protein KAR31_12055 [Candidatus Omnitrophica bacterium]|nr:hypothetical protein [Candidatus Omnitrophota bacterium]